MPGELMKPYIEATEAFADTIMSLCQRGYRTEKTQYVVFYLIEVLSKQGRVGLISLSKNLSDRMGKKIKPSEVLKIIKPLTEIGIIRQERSDLIPPYIFSLNPFIAELMVKSKYFDS